MRTITIHPWRPLVLLICALLGVASAAEKPIKIVTLGDSITKGVRRGVKAEETFAALLESALKKQGFDVAVINVGIGGERTDQALKRLVKDVIAKKPTLVTIMYGTNDSYVDRGKADSRISLDSYTENLRQLVTALRKAGVAPVLMTEPRWGDAARKNGVGEHPNERLAMFVDGCRKVATEMKVPLVDHFKHWSDQEVKGVDVGKWTTDQCHPNPAGHKIIAETILPVIRKTLNVAEKSK